MRNKPATKTARITVGRRKDPKQPQSDAGKNTQNLTNKEKKLKEKGRYMRNKKRLKEADNASADNAKPPTPTPTPTSTTATPQPSSTTTPSSTKSELSSGLRGLRFMQKKAEQVAEQITNSGTASTNSDSKPRIRVVETFDEVEDNNLSRLSYGGMNQSVEKLQRVQSKKLAKIEEKEMRAQIEINSKKNMDVQDGEMAERYKGFFGKGKTDKMDRAL